MDARRPLRGRPDLAVVFASPHFAGAPLLDAIHEAAAPAHVIGCTAEGVVGGSKEVEAKAAVSVWLAELPGEVQTFHLEYEGSPEKGELAGWNEEEADAFVVLCDPFSFPADLLLELVNEKMPGQVLVGGLASGAATPGQARLFLDRSVLASGAVVARLRGVPVRTAVSQGCRPVGQTFTVTRAEGNFILELAGKPSVERIREMYAKASPEDQRLMSEGLLIGRVMNEYKTDFERCDFLVRSVLGAHQESGAIVVGDSVDVGETVQFHVRDASSADDDLRSTLAAIRAGGEGNGPVAGLLFTCNGRGSRMFDVPDHDAALVSKELGDPPIAGFFCAGEIGPVGGRNFLHGFTASMALFYEDARSD